MLSLVRTLIYKHKLSVATCDYVEGFTPLHKAASNGYDDVVSSLITEFNCDPNTRDSYGRSSLHVACANDKAHIVKLLSQYMSPLVVDNNGDTPLHISSVVGSEGCVNVLLHLNAPILIRNNSGKSARDVACGGTIKILDEYMKANTEKIYQHYSIVQQHAKKMYAFAKRITRVFVIGNPGAGKSSLIDSLKRGGQIYGSVLPSLTQVSPHTAGIVPSIFTTSLFGRVIFFDFAGDREYYSSHAAILENIASSRKGDNIFIIVVDLREDIADILHYWLSFIQHQKLFNGAGKKPSLIVVGSHSDLVCERVVCEKTTEIVNLCGSAEKSAFYSIVQTMLDCRKSKSRQIDEIFGTFRKITRQSPLYNLSLGATILLGLFGKDFSSVTACSVQTIISHISSTGIQLPTDVQSLLAILHELHDVGLLFMVTVGSSNTNKQIVLNTSQLTNKVHQLLFSKEARASLTKVEPGLQGPSISSLDIGIISQEILKKILPQYITKECLLQLQYCQEISGREVQTFLPSAHFNSKQTFLFFPALINLNRSDVSWLTPSEISFSIGLLMRCTNPHEYYPPRFLHVLLLRLIFNFSLSYSVQAQTPFAFTNSQRSSTMWKTGVHWFMKNGVECMVELVSTNKGVLIITKSPENMIEECIKVFEEISRYVSEARKEFCYSINPQFFFLDSTENESTYLHESNLSSVETTERSVGSSHESLVSLEDVPIQKRIKCMNRNLLLHKLTLWNRVFPINFASVLRRLTTLPLSKAYELGSTLDIPQEVLETVQKDFPSLVRGWMSSSQDPPCWWRLVQALKRIQHSAEAEDIANEYGDEIQLQMTLLSSDKQNIKPNEEFLELFANVVKSQWPSLSFLLLPENSVFIRNLRTKEEELSQQELALTILKKWASQDSVNYGQLCKALMTRPLFQ